MKFLLLGGNGFLGMNLIDQLKIHKIEYISIDKKFIDLTDTSSISKINQIISENNITNIVCLASNVGIDIFNNKNALNSALSNQMILSNFIQILLNSNYKLDVTWYSTSEIYGSSKACDNLYVSTNDIRNSYSQIKILGETYIKQLYKQGVISNYHIIRPFNPSGKYQKKGVVYSMLQFAMKRRIISFNDNTTRMISDVQEFSRQSFDDILKKENTCVNYYDASLSMTLETLAIIIWQFVKEKHNIDVKLMKMPFDAKIQYRHVGRIQTIDTCKDKIYRILNQLYDDI